mmetsp:Transcript_87846/g.268823  ORF Transcript_87846/g.268823 Transcript_87846/m.268823 type:complete len:207 (+) Transcript_87846:1778-2398(+)
MSDLPALAAQHKIHASEDVLRKVQRLCRLGDASLLHHVLFVHDVGVSIVHPRAEEGVAPLQDSAKCELRAGSEVADRTKIAGDMLREADDPLRLVPAALVRAEFTQNARQEKQLLKVRALVRVDALAISAAHEGHRVVLVVAFAIAQNRESGQLDLQPRSSPPNRQHQTISVDQAAEIAARLPLMDAVDLGGDVLLARIDESHLEA